MWRAFSILSILWLGCAASLRGDELRWCVRGWYAIANPAQGDPFSLNPFLHNPEAHHGHPLLPADIRGLRDAYGSATGSTDRWTRLLYDWMGETDWLHYREPLIRLFQRGLILRPSAETATPLPTHDEILGQILTHKENLDVPSLPPDAALPLQLEVLPPLRMFPEHRLRGDKGSGYAVVLFHDADQYGLLAELIGGVFTKTDQGLFYPWVYTPLVALPRGTVLRTFASWHDAAAYAQ